MVLHRIAEKHRKINQEIDPWIGSKYEYIRNAGTDATGKIGEEFVYELLKSLFKNYNIIWGKDKNSNHKDGVYDIKIIDDIISSLLLRLEVKTATQGKSGSFQHEKILGKEFCDKIIFLDITPNGFYITILNVEEIDFSGKERSILGRSLHIRSNSGQTKLDFGDATLRNGLKFGKTIYITNEENEIKELNSFLIKNIMVCNE